MLRSILLAAALLGSPLLSADLPPYTPCPIIGPRYPIPSGLSQWPSVKDALVNLTNALDALITSDGQSEFTDTTPNTTTFAIAAFDSEDGNDGAPTLLYEFYHLAPSFENTTAIDSSNVYNIGGVSQVFTVYAFLAAAGEEMLEEPVTKFVPELASESSIDWSSVLLRDLATHLAGIPREATEDTISAMMPSELSALLPKASNGTQPAPASEQEFLKVLGGRKPIYQPGTTPIYSNAAFELLAIVLERITGEDFVDIMQKHVFEPLGVSSTSIGTPASDTNGIIPVNKTASGWDLEASQSALNAATGMFSSLSDMSTIGKSMLRSTILSETTTNRWLKPFSYTSNPRNGVGMPWDIFAPSLSDEGHAPIVPIFTKLGAQGLYSPYFGLNTDHNTGFAILSADTEQAADLNAYADLVFFHLVYAVEKAAAEQAAVNYKGNYTSEDGTAQIILDVDGLSGITVLNWTSTSQNGAEVDVKGAYAELYSIPAHTLDLRLYPTNLKGDKAATKGNRGLTFRAVAQDVAAPVDGGTPTCITWETVMDVMIHNGLAMDEFVFELDAAGAAVSVGIPALDMVLHK